jgi:hypothetical protein
MSRSNFDTRINAELSDKTLERWWRRQAYFYGAQSCKNITARYARYGLTSFYSAFVKAASESY